MCQLPGCLTKLSGNKVFKLTNCSCFEIAASGRCLPQDQSFGFQDFGFEEIDTSSLLVRCRENTGFPGQNLEAILLPWLSFSHAKEFAPTGGLYAFPCAKGTVIKWDQGCRCACYCGKNISTLGLHPFFFLKSIMDVVDAQRSETQRGVLQTEYFMPLHVLAVD